MFALVGALGCGKVSSGADASSGIDGDVGDGGATTPDAPVDAPTHGTVTVQVYQGGALVEGISVFYHEPDGSYIASMLTDANGEVVIPDMPVGGAVTAPVSPWDNGGLRAHGFSGNVLSSVTGVQIGDVIILGKSRQFEDTGGGSTVGSVNVTPPGAAPGATRYVAYAGCDSDSATVVGEVLTPSLEDGCVPGDNTVDVVAYAENGSGNRVAYSTATNVALSGTPPAVTGSTTLGAWQTDFGVWTLNLTNAPTDLDVESQFIGIRENIFMETFNPGGAAITSGGNGALQARMAPGVYDESVFAIAAQVTDGTNNSVALLSFRATGSPAAGSPTTTNINLTSELPGLITNVSASGEPLTVNWTAGSTSCKDNPTMDSVMTFVIGDTSVPAATGVSPQYTWVVLSRGDATSVTLPQLDPALAQTLWPSSTFNTIQTGVLIRADSTLTYDDLRNSPDNLAYFTYVPPAVGTHCFITGGFLGAL